MVDATSCPVRLEVFLTFAEAEKLQKVLQYHCDEGPLGEGWSSRELDTLRGKIEKSLEGET